jgi:predicted metal-dependent hydrolase
MATGRVAEIPDPGERGVPRYSRRAFPAYRYVPGVRPHPNRDPTGHSYLSTPQLTHHAPWDPEEWRTLDDWLYGVDLFNRFYFWEAHEAWEGLWAAVEGGSSASLLLQGLIQIAAALLKTHMGVLSAARALSSEGLDKLQRAAATHPRLLGLDLQSVKERFAHYFASLEHNELPVIGPEVPALEPTAGLCL